ncbi:MAG: lipopolysaccharide biosynthesis protein [Brevundimonas sp.]|uniref:lipopolysaccharide biosynthesis protein n=1 Tax=Brevundimonas sp. TaxID=1871086 RepID=UPI002732730E|nr:lipopolysaccharide biosynthesis protein [Brevundimonas sp.]MDP3405220.1 lipopolysaccharide biosynthesis protein [Brevundimonas sp.]
MIGKSVSRSAAVMAGVQLLVKSFDMIAVVLIARVLAPAEFGLVILASSVLLVANSLTELPVIDVLVQRSKLEARDIDSAFTLTVMRGLLIALVLVLVSGPLAVLLNDPRLELIIKVLAIAPFAQGLASPAMVHHLRAVNYAPMAQTQLFGKVVSFVAMVTVVWFTRSYWALVAGLVAAPVISALSTHFLAPYRPRFDTSGFKKILHFASWVTLSRIVFTLNQQADRFFVGLILGKAPLGQYAMGGDIAALATYTIASAVMQPLFAGFARMKDDRPRLINAYLKGQQILVTLIAPIGFGLGAIALPLITLLLGETWRPAVTVIWWLAPAIALQMLAVPVQSLAMATGRPHILVFREVLALVLRLPLTLLAAWMFGLAAAAATRSLSGVIIVLINLGIAGRVLDLSLFRQLLNCHRSLIAAVVMAGVLLLAQFLTPPIANFWLRWLELGGLVLLGAATYGSVVFGLWVIQKRPTGAEEWMIEKIPARVRAPLGLA